MPPVAVMSLTRTLAVLLLGSAWSHVASAQPDEKAVVWQRIKLGSAAAQYQFAVYSNHRIEGDMRAIRQAVIILPGFLRNGDVYFTAAERLAAMSGIDSSEILLVTPQFFATPDASRIDISPMPVWTINGWLVGEESVSGHPRLSSFKVMDDLLTWLFDRQRFPGLERIVIAGNSGGAQLVQRYAALNGIDETIRKRGIDLNYVVSAPGSYLYFTDDRSRGDNFAPYDAARCPGFNDYKYGFTNIVHYAARHDPAEALSRYASRNVAYLVGRADNNPAGRVLDKSCAAMAQGQHRLERTLTYVRYLRHLSRTKTAISHRAFEVVGAGHDHEDVLGSVCGLQLLFNTAGDFPGDRPPCVEITEK